MARITQKLRNLFGSQAIHVNITSGDAYVIDMSARKLYATQANLHAVVKFLADSVSQLPLYVYERVDEDDRRLDRESVAALLLRRPNCDQTTYEFINATMIELMLFGVVAWWKLPDADSQSGYQLRVIPRDWVIDTSAETNYAPDVIRIAAGTGGWVDIDRDEFVLFRIYSPSNPSGYQSPLKALQQTLTEQIEADRFRTEVWKSSGRFNAYISRPKDVTPWTDEQRKQFVADFREAWGAGGSKAGKMPLLEDGMTIQPYQFNAKEAQYVETKQLSREDVAAAYHVNPSLIWHTDTQTYASAKDNARALYADCLGSVLQMMQQRINSFLLPMLGMDPNYYVEFDLTEKLKGSFEERASILQTAVGGPWMTRDEARADNNLPPLPNGQGKEIITPLNVVEGGLAGPNDTDPTEQEYENLYSWSPARKDNERTSIKGRADENERKRVSTVLSKFFKRQSSSVLPKIGVKSASVNWWDEDRWNQELSDDLYPEFLAIATAHGNSTGRAIGWRYSSDQTEEYLKKMAYGRASAINSSTRKKLQTAIEASMDTEESDLPDSKTPSGVFELMETSGAERLGIGMATAVAGWAVLEAVDQAAYHGMAEGAMKTWVCVPTSQPRPEHVAMDGETVPYNEPFSNGAMWPGDTGALDVDEVANCQCEVEVFIP